MIGILIIAHAPLATALKEFVAHVYSDVPERILSLDVTAHEDAKVTLEKAVALAQPICSHEGMLVLTDIMGATPANVASRLAHLPEFDTRVRVIAGVNLPMLMRAIAYRSEGLDSVTNKAMHGGQQGIISLGYLGIQEEKVNPIEKVVGKE
jgi:PTS system ascorbate-specific IIA component